MFRNEFTSTRLNVDPVWPERERGRGGGRENPRDGAHFPFPSPLSLVLSSLYSDRLCLFDHLSPSSQPPYITTATLCPSQYAARTISRGNRPEQTVSGASHAPLTSLTASSLLRDHSLTFCHRRYLPPARMGRLVSAMNGPVDCAPISLITSPCWLRCL